MVEIKEYCEKSGLNFEKVLKFKNTGNCNICAIQYFDPHGGAQGLLDETPAELLLLIEKKDNGIEFTQYENALKYLV